MKKKLICTILTLAFTCGLAFGIYQICDILQEYEEGTDAYEDLGEYIELPDASEDSEGAKAPSETQSESGETDESSIWPQVDFEALKSVNSDIVGWIYLESSEINYPIPNGAGDE